MLSATHIVCKKPLKIALIYTLFHFRVIHYFVGLADDVICLHNRKKVYKVDDASKYKLNQKLISISMPF